MITVALQHGERVRIVYANREVIVETVREDGYAYVALDIRGRVDVSSYREVTTVVLPAVVTRD